MEIFSENETENKNRKSEYLEYCNHDYYCSFIWIYFFSKWKRISCTPDNYRTVYSLWKSSKTIEANLPAISLSVGVAFSDKENPGESIFKDADKALYYVKEHGKSGCGFY